MDKKSLKQEIKQLEPWYHPIDFGDGVITTGKTKAFLKGRTRKVVELKSDQRGLKKWNRFIAPYLPIPLQGARILDIGCNSALFSLRCLQDGASYALGVDNEPRYIKQALFLKKFFSERDGKEYNLDVVQGDMESLDSYLNADFDLCIMLNVLRMIRNYDESIQFLKKIQSRCSHIIVQGTYGNKKDDESILEEKLQKAGYDTKLHLKKGNRGVICIGTRRTG